MVLGVHTPETGREKVVSNVRSDAKEQELTFPIVVDGDHAAWKAWGNRMWPSVYLINRDGYIVRWWYGELNWEGAGAQNIFAEHIDKLLG